MLYLLENCHNCYNCIGAFYWCVYWVTLSEYIFNSATIWKRKWKKKKNLTNHFFFLCCICRDVHFQLPNLAYLRAVCVCTFLLYISRITIRIMGWWFIPTKSKLHLQLENLPHQISDRWNCPTFNNFQCSTTRTW